ncbi:MAG: DUF5916 domain-containing protein [Vicinamibacterales bacterium]
MKDWRVVGMVAAFVAWHASAAAQVPDGGAAPEAAGDPRPASPALVDVKSIDPESFRAIVVRVPDGQTPRIDGRLDEPIWQAAPPQGHFIQREPTFGAPSTEETEFRVLYDDRNLYFGVWVWDRDPAHILGSEMKRDSGLRKGDQIKIAIDTFHDHRNSYIFFTNPLGAYKDAQSVENGRTINYDWNAVWENQTSVDGRGWYIEARIPLSQIRFRGDPGDVTWGLNVCRILMRRNEESYWVPFPREWGAGGLARMGNAGVLAGLTDLRPKRRVEVLPYVLPRASDDFGPPAGAGGRHRDFKVEGGLDLKIGLTDELTADLTYNTDFAQVEADQEVVNNTRFSLFFPEKRVFFTESAGVFDYGKSGSSAGGEAAANDPGILPLFYSRQIGLVDGQEVPIVGGGKVTGKVGAFSVGLLNITTDAQDTVVGGRAQRVPGANFTALRVKRNILKQSTIGAIVLDRQGGLTDYNRSVGLDAGFLFGANTTLTGLFARTASPGLSGKDTAGVLDFIWKSDRFNYGLQYADIGQNFNAEMGFIVRTDIRSTKAKAAWTPRPKWSGVRQLQFNGLFENFEDHAGRLQSRTSTAEFQLSRQDTSSAKLTVTRDLDTLDQPFAVAATRIPVGRYEFTSLAANYTSNQARRISGSANLEAGEYYNGHRQTGRVSLNFQVGRTLLLEPNYTRNHITLPDRPGFTSNILNLRVSQSFSPELFLKTYAQYNDERKSASFQFLLWYIYRPGSDFYVVYNQGWDTDVPTGPRARVRGRSLAVKMTYWWAR